MRRRLKVEADSPGELPEEKRRDFDLQLRTFTERVWRSPKRRKYRWEMAILFDPEEAMPPSDKEAIQRFIRAAAKVGIEAETVRSKELSNVSEYDALFIRETTSIDHPTYRLARRAEKEGLVVMDDPTSIMRCCNKIFLQDAFAYNNISAPKTLVVADSTPATFERIESELSYPIVLKMPESSFSVGVFKVKNHEELEQKLNLMLKDSSLALVQEYLYTNYDWRIGVLNGRAIYACKYFMARGHWQIYNHHTDQPRHHTGGFETIATFEVPRAVLKAALKACTAARAWPASIQLRWCPLREDKGLPKHLLPNWRMPLKRRTVFSCVLRWRRLTPARSDSTKSSATWSSASGRTTTRTIPMHSEYRSRSAWQEVDDLIMVMIGRYSKKVFAIQLLYIMSSIQWQTVAAFFVFVENELNLAKTPWWKSPGMPRCRFFAAWEPRIGPEVFPVSNGRQRALHRKPWRHSAHRIRVRTS